MEALEVLDRSESGEIDVILMDVEMPVMDGIEATRRIRERYTKNVDDEGGGGMDEIGAIPILGLSGNARHEHRERALQAGMSDYVVKPYERSKLFEMIETWAENKRRKMAI